MFEIGIVIAVIIAIAEGAKRIGLDAKWIPLLDVALGIAIACVWIYPADIRMAIWQGLIAGLSASGLYSGVKNTAQSLRG